MIILIGFLLATSLTLAMWNLARVANGEQPNRNIAYGAMAFLAAGWLLFWLS